MKGTHMNDKYILDASGNPVPEPDLMKWAEWFEQNRDQRKIALDEFTVGDVPVRVSTVFLGLDLSWGREPPLLWETMVFGGALNEDQARCGGSKEQAMAQHATMVARARQGAK